MSKCRDPEAIPGCFIPTDPTVAPVGVIVSMVYGADDKPYGNYATTFADPTTAIDPAEYLGGGEVFPGACPVTVDKEQVVLCDDLGDPTATPVRFVRTRICVLAANGFVTSETVTDTELDMTTAYVVVGEVKECATDCPEEEPAGLITSFE